MYVDLRPRALQGIDHNIESYHIISFTEYLWIGGYTPGGFPGCAEKYIPMLVLVVDRGLTARIRGYQCRSIGQNNNLRVHR